MIQENELRIGNLFIEESSNKIIEVIGLEKNRIVFSGMFLDKWKAKPIPITEERLLKFGFENWGVVHINEFEKYNRFVFFNAVDGTSNYEVHFLESTYGNQLYKEIIFSIDNEPQRVKQTDFVHNLQNHFKISVGYELTLKP